MKTTEEYLELAKKIAERGKDELADNSFKSSVSFNDETDEPRLILFPETHDVASRDMLLRCIVMLGACIDNLDSIAFVSDTCRVKEQFKVDGSKWEYGDMQKALNDPSDPNHDLIGEALMLQVTDSTGRMAMISVPYDRDDEGIKFDWDAADAVVEDENPEEGRGFKAEGAFSDAFRGAFLAPKIAPKIIDQMKSDYNLTGEDFGLDQAAARLHTLSIGVKIVLRHAQLACLVPCRTEEEAELLRHSMKNGPMTEGISSFSKEEIEEVIQLNEAFEAPAFGE